jgi:hypothetical protein
VAILTERIHTFGRAMLARHGELPAFVQRSLSVQCINVSMRASFASV